MRGKENTHPLFVVLRLILTDAGRAFATAAKARKHHLAGRRAGAVIVSFRFVSFRFKFDLFFLLSSHVAIILCTNMYWVFGSRKDADLEQTRSNSKTMDGKTEPKPKLIMDGPKRPLISASMRAHKL